VAALLCLAGIAGSMWSAAAAIAIAPVVRVLMFWAFPEHERLIHQAFPTTMDSIAAGCLYAGARHYFRSAEEGPLVVRSGVIALGLVVGAFICNSLSVHPWFKYAMGASLMNLAIVGVIDFVVNTNGRCDRVLNWPPIVYIGTLSYSLYLWQQLFMNRQTTFVCSFPVECAASVGVSAFSYHARAASASLAQRFRHHVSPARKAMRPASPRHQRSRDPGGASGRAS
jgi:peptidoglycan/LPS O-acetylase OafA/YrhL